MNVALPANADNAHVAEAVANSIRELNADLGLPKFSELGFSYEDLPELAQLVMSDSCVYVLRMSVQGREVTDQDFLAPMQKEFTRK